MSDGSANLPQEIITELLIRLPVKSIGRSRCVTKPWLSLLSSYEFIKAHVARHTHLAQEQKLILNSSSNSLFTLALHPGSCLSRKLESFDGKSIYLVGSCNGLVLAVTEGNIKCLMNCTTGEYAKLPNSPLALLPSSARFIRHGFGYDSLTDDYKIVTLSRYHTQYDIDNKIATLSRYHTQYDTDNEHEPDTFIDIYSSKMRCWRRFVTSPYDHFVPEHGSGVFFNGALHWIGWKSLSDESSFIVALDLGSEKFKEISIPAHL